MNTQLTHTVAPQRSAEQQHAGHQARFADEMSAEWRTLRDPNPLIPLKSQPGPGTPRAVSVPQAEPAIGCAR
jgi:hypothetical protein